jgi:CxxC motif-containing protein
MQMASLKKKKSLVMFTVLVTSAGVAFASCGGTESLVSSAAVAAATSLATSVAGVGAKLIAEDNSATEQLISAIRIVAKQVDTSSAKSAATNVQAEQSVAAVQKSIADQEMANKIVADYTSQGFDPCGVSVITKKVAVAEAQTKASAAARVSTEIQAGGGRFASPAETLLNREKQHRELFCSQSEVDAGICSSLGKLPGGDSNAALLFSTDTSVEGVAAKNALINNIIGVPDAPLPVEVASTPAAQAYLLEKKKKDAFLAFPAYSLKSIQSENESFKAVMDERIGQYFGTPRAAAWAKDQMSQQARGILVDLVKIQGLELKIRERKLNSNMRLEANLAAMLELQNQQINTPVTQAAAQQALTAAAASKVK